MAGKLSKEQVIENLKKAGIQFDENAGYSELLAIMPREETTAQPVEAEIFDWLKFPQIETEYAPDAARIHKALECMGYACTLKQAYDLWRAYSVKHNEDDPACPLNGWFPVPDAFDGIVSKLKHNIIPEFMPK